MLAGLLYVSECNDTYVALGGGPPGADIFNTVVLGEYL